MMTEMLFLLFRLLRVSLLSLRVFNIFLLKFRRFSILTLLTGGTKTVVLEEAVLEEERPYPKPVRSEADF